jgi:hypothetical protein
LKILVSFLRGPLTNHGTPPTLHAIRSNPVRPRIKAKSSGKQRIIPDRTVGQSSFSARIADTPENTLSEAQVLLKSHDFVMGDGPGGLDELSRTMIRTGGKTVGSSGNSQ